MCEKDIQDKIIEILLTIYYVPGQFFLASILALGFYEVSKVIIFLFFSIFFMSLEIISPILVGVELYENAIEKIKEFIKKS
jgi:hypothetical protein